MVINNNADKKYEDLNANDYFICKITIIELAEKYKLKERHISRIVDIHKYKTDGYIPFFHSKKELIIGATYEIRGYMYEDGYLRTFKTHQIIDEK